MTSDLENCQKSTLFLSIERYSRAPDDRSSKEGLLSAVSERVDVLARHMLHANFRVARWDETQDIAQAAKMKLWRALDEVVIVDKTHLLRLVAKQIRRVVIERYRKYTGPEGLGSNHHTGATSSQADGQNENRDQIASHGEDDKRLASLEIHDAVERLPPEERETFDLLYYNGLTQSEAAEILSVSEKTIGRRWKNARLVLADILNAAS